MKNLFLLYFSLFISTFIFSQSTEIVYLSGADAANTVEWDFFCTDGQNSDKWTKIDVPSNWELEGFGTYNYGFDWRNKEVKLGKEHGLYKYKFEVPADWKGKLINIVFDGSMTDTKVKINGISAGKIHQGAFYRFKYDISNLLKFGETNLLEVDVAKHSNNESVNRAERQADFWIFGGIFRPVFLEALPQIHIKRAAINAKADGSFHNLVVLNKSKSNYSISVDLFDLQGNKVGKTIISKTEKWKTENSISGKFNNIKSWNPEKPTLYDMKITLKKGKNILHEVVERIGFRTVELRQHDGFYINDKKIVFKGINRHSFNPETGRSLSEENHLNDIRLMKEMNMNAVRMSHYVPDKRFLELCDSLGLFVFNELTGWHDYYDSIVGPKLIKEMILKDENHPSVVIWDHGNEGGWNPPNEKWFHYYDIQKRPVIRPWLLHNGVDTHHYPPFDFAVNRFTNGNDPFMPTEFLHGLYDGGHGAGLEDYWNHYEKSPLFAGGFLWVLADEAVLRTDKKGTFFDSHGNFAPDGIIGPHQEKEASFYTVKEIWSPVQIEPVTINKQWDGNLFLKNKYIYTNLKECTFSWETQKTSIGSAKREIVKSGTISNLNAEPGETVKINIDCQESLQNADLFLFTAVDHHGKEIYTWSWPIIQPIEKAKELVLTKLDEFEVETSETDKLIIASVDKLIISFNKKDGTIQNIQNKNGKISFSGGPVPVGVNSKIKNVKWGKNKKGNFKIEILYSNYPHKITWIVYKNGLLYLEAGSLQKGLEELDFVGISFNYPEEKCKSISWMGRGPYRVWKNRTKGNNIGVWEKEYNNTITGESFDNLIYPEFNPKNSL